MNKEASTDSFNEDFSMSIVYVDTEVSESIEDIMHWNITKFNTVIKMLGKINKLKNGPEKSSSTVNVMG